MKKIIITILAATMLLMVWSCGDRFERFRPLLPGEIEDPLWPVPIIVSVRDTSCSDSIPCPSKAGDCVKRDFMVQIDTTYYLTVSYFNGDTITPSCRACGTVYQGDSVIMHNYTACPTGGPWIAIGRLKPDVKYTLVVCMQRCPKLSKCNCGRIPLADAIVSIRRVFSR